MSKRTILDLTERTVATFVQAFLAIALVGGVGDQKQLKIAGTAGALAVGKFLYAKVNVYLAPPKVEVVPVHVNTTTVNGVTTTTSEVLK